MALTYLETQAQILLRLGASDLELIQNFIIETAQAVPFVGNLAVTGNITATGSIAAGTTLAAATGITAGTTIAAGGLISTTANITAGTSIAATTTVTGAGVISSANMQVQNNGHYNVDGTLNNDNAFGRNATGVVIRNGGGSFLQAVSSTARAAFGGYVTSHNFTDTSGSPGNASANTVTGKSAVALGDSAVTISNTSITATSLVFVTPLASDATLTRYYVTVSSNQFILTGNAVATAAFPFQWYVVN